MASKTDGFVRIPNWLIDDSDLSAHELLVYTVLLRFRDPKTGKCFPGMTTIADRARISRKSVERTIPLLEKRGIVRVERRSTVTDNKPNMYEVSVATEKPESIWASSARGRRVPKRVRTNVSESVGKGVTFEPTDSESVPTDSLSVPTDSESVPPQTPSLPKKIHGRSSNEEIHEQAIRSTLQSGPVNFSFNIETPRATEKQLTYLHDLHIHLTGHIPNTRNTDKWAALTLSEAQQLIGQYLRQIPRYDAYEGPEYGDPAYDALTPIGKQWADSGFIPDILEVA
ncbi:helix-turn-helix domain-containing protein [Microbacterium paludicola]|uniref:helix-turn-helix domain-containing protein n=1 Tax=Microbacterium paludicola TaxID=300019 RepID=UPI0011A6F2AC|nr:helix-turn-helix domain-containing protein [Microbacterium paludicola]